MRSLEIRDPDDFEGTFEAARRQRPDALITVEDPLTVDHRKRIADFAVGQQLPSLHGVREFAAAFVRRMDQAIASEQRSAEMRRELRMRDYEVESE